MLRRKPGSQTRGIFASGEGSWDLVHRVLDSQLSTNQILTLDRVLAPLPRKRSQERPPGPRGEGERERGPRRDWKARTWSGASSNCTKTTGFSWCQLAGRGMAETRGEVSRAVAESHGLCSQIASCFVSAVHRPQKPAGSTHSSTRDLRPPEQLERPAGFPSSDKTRPDSPVPTLQGPCGRSP